MWAGGPAELGTSSLCECPAHPWEGHHTPLGCLVADPSAATGTLPGTAKQEDLTHTHYKQKYHPPPPPSGVPVTRSPVFYLTLQRGLFQDVLQAGSERLPP